MGIKKIPCGGFRYDDETVEFNNGVMKAKGASKEVTNAIETGGMGWTDEEVKEGYDIQWDGNTEGLEKISEIHYKISDIPLTADDLLGGTIEFSEGRYTNADQITQDYLIVDEYRPMISVGDLESNAILVSITSDFSPISDVTISKGLYAIKTTSEKETIFDKEINVNQFVESWNFYRGSYTLDGDMPLYAFADYAIFIDDVFVEEARAYSMPTGGVMLGTVPGSSYRLIEEYAGVRTLCWTESGTHTLRLEKIISESTQFLSVTKQSTTEEVVHQIDQKYIPQSGGAMVVTFENLDWETSTIDSDKTPQEVFEAMSVGQVVTGIITLDGMTVPLGAATVSAGESGDSFNPSFMLLMTNAQRFPTYLLHGDTSENVWIPNGL